MPVQFQFCIAAGSIAILGLLGFCAEAAMAQTATQLQLASLGPTEMVAEPTLAPASRGPFGLAIVSVPLEPRSPNYFEGYFDANITSSIKKDTTYLSNGDSSAVSNSPIGLVRAPRRDSLDILSNFIAAYKSLQKSLAVEALPLIEKYAALTGTSIVGVASTYNPYRDEITSDEMPTASGELYDPTAWTAAIQINLREQFRGVRCGKNYQAAYALVESGEREAIVKINDVGPLKPGRVIDLNERSMRYFDPTLQLGLISNVKVTLLPGADWTAGPIGSEQPISVATAK